MTAEQNQATMQRFMASMGEEHPDLSSIFTEDFVDHDPADGQPAGGQGLLAYWGEFGKGFPDMQITPEEEAVDDDHITSVATITGTHTGEWQGIAPTGERVSVRMVQVAKFRDGRFSERWGSTDELGILRQIGAFPAK